MKVVLFCVAERVIIDEQKKLTSLINIVETLTVGTTETSTVDKNGRKRLIPIQLSAVAMFVDPTDEEAAKGTEIILKLDTEDGEVLEMPMAVDFKNTGRFRATFNFEHLPLCLGGDYRFSIRTRASEAPIATYSIKVELKPPKRTARPMVASKKR
jgi:hypothetical protein